MVVGLEQGADLHVVQLMPLPRTVTCFSKIQIGFTFLVVAHLGSPGKRAVKRVCVCVCVYCTGNVRGWYLLVECGRLVHVAVDLGLASKVLELSGASDGRRRRSLVLDRQHFVESDVHLIDQIHVQLAQK